MASDDADLRAILIDGIGRHSDEEANRLSGHSDPSFVKEKLESLRGARTWVWSVVISMTLLALILPTAVIFQIFVRMGSLTKPVMFLVLVGGSTFSAVQMGIALHVYRNWKQRLLCYRALHALHSRDA